MGSYLFPRTAAGQHVQNPRRCVSLTSVHVCTFHLSSSERLRKSLSSPLISVQDPGRALRAQARRS